MTTTDNLSSLLEDTSDPNTPHGKCNAVYVSYEPSTEQAAALTAYSAKFKVCRVDAVGADSAAVVELWAGTSKRRGVRPTTRILYRILQWGYPYRVGRSYDIRDNVLFEHETALVKLGKKIEGRELPFGVG